MTDPTFWIAARATGIVAYGLLSVVMLMGITLSGRGRVRGLSAGDVNELHRFVALLALLMTGVHGVALVLDGAVDIPIAGLLVPGLVPYRTLWTSLGVVSAWVTLALYLSFAVRKRIGPRVWRRLHYASYGAFAAAAAHGLLAGTDSGRGWVLAMYGGTVGAVIGATVWRAGVERKGARARAGRTPARAAA